MSIDIPLLDEPDLRRCTGWRAEAALADAFAPGRYGPSAVGARQDEPLSRSG